MIVTIRDNLDNLIDQHQSEILKNFTMMLKWWRIKF